MWNRQGHHGSAWDLECWPRLCIEHDLNIHTDSAAAVGICKRAGIGRVRHLAVGLLWVQEGLRRGDFRQCKVQGDANPADALTKHLSREVLDKHVAALSLKRMAG